MKKDKEKGKGSEQSKRKTRQVKEKATAEDTPKDENKWQDFLRRHSKVEEKKKP